MKNLYPADLKDQKLRTLTPKGVKVLPFFAETDLDPRFFRHKTRYSFSIEAGKIVVTPKTPHLFLVQSEKANQIVNFIADYATQNNWQLFEKSDTGWLKHVVIREGKRTGEIMVLIYINGSNLENKEIFLEQLTQEFPEIVSIFLMKSKGRSNEKITEELVFGNPAITEMVNGYQFRISPQSFFQTNATLIEALYQSISESVQELQPDLIWDLYAGSATIGISVSKYAKEAISVEQNSQNCADAEWAITQNKIQNCKIICSTVEDFLEKQTNRPDCIIIDPSRSGLSGQALQNILTIKAQNIILVSCNPETFFRDLQVLVKNGYRLQKIQGLDMFPYAAEWETVAMLSL